MKKILAALTVAAIMPVAAGFYASFDDSLSLGGNEPVKTANLSFTNGVRGRAVYIPENGLLEYEGKALKFSQSRGTFILWIKTDWSVEGAFDSRDSALIDGKWEWMASSKKGRTIVSFGSFQMGLGMRFGARCYDTGITTPLRDLVNAGEWHQYAVTYDEESKEFKIYFDGRFREGRKFKEIIKDKSPPWRVRIGCGLRRGGNVGPRPSVSAAFDELRYEPRVWSEKEIAEDFLSVVPYRVELLDWSVWKGETRNLRFRVRNVSSKPVSPRFKISDGRTVPLKLAPGELKEFTLPVTVSSPGPFNLVMKDGAYFSQTFKLQCLSRDVCPPQAEGSLTETLVGEYDCTRDYPSNVFNECGSRIVTNSPCGTYRECDIQLPGVGFAYRFKIAEKGAPHRVEIDYPDDCNRKFSFGVWHENYNRLFTGTIDCAGIITGLDVPVTMKMQRKSFIFWPDSDTVTVGVMGYKAHKKEAPGRPAAAAAVRLYRLSGLPAAPSVGASSSRRSVGKWDEDPTMDSELVFNHAVNYDKADLEFWRIKWTRIIDYMRHMGIDTWVIKALSYRGDVTFMNATLGHPSYPMAHSNGRCPGWAEIGAAMLDNAGMDIWIRYNHKYVTPDSCMPSWVAGGDRSKDLYFLDNKGEVPRHYTKFNFLHPAVREEFKSVIRAYRDKFKVYPRFRGITMNEDPGLDFANIATGYDDYTAGLFTKDTGIALPGTPSERYERIMNDSGLLERWLDWRCAKIAEIAREFTEALRDDGGKYELQFWVRQTRLMKDQRDWFVWDPGKALRACGVDLKRLSAIEGLRVVPMVGVDDVHYLSRYDWNTEAFIYLDSYRRMMRDANVNMFNMVPVNLEIYPSITQKKNYWKRPFWLTTGSNMGGRYNFYNYATGHVNSKFVLEAFVAMVADYDVQDILHGWWGITESGDNDRFREFYTQLRSIPRGRYELAPGVNEPVAARVGEKGFYLVNREPYPIKTSWIRDGKSETAELKNGEIRWFPVGKCSVSDLTCVIPEEEKKLLGSRIEIVRKASAANPDDPALADVATRATAAFSSGRYTTARGLLRSAPARKAFLKHQIAK